jgi:hypothetical protein
MFICCLSVKFLILQGLWIDVRHESSFYGVCNVEKDFKTHFNLQTWGENFFIGGQATI